MDWGLAGYGDLSERRLVAAFRAAGHRLRAVWGRDPERARRFAERHGIERAARDPADLCRGVDAVYIATPVAAHVPLAEIALRSGCHVLLEKPVSPGLEPAEPLLALAAQRNLRIGVAYYRRLSPALRRVRALLSGGLLGRPREAEIHFRSPFDPEPGDPKLWRTDRAVSGGGVLADAGCHRLDLLEWLWGTPVTVEARLSDFFPAGAERRADLRLTWPGGATARCLFEWAAGPRDRFRLVLEQGELTLDPLDGGTLSWCGPDGAQEEIHPVPDHPHLALIEDFALALASGVLPVCPLEEGIRVDRLLEAAVRSHESGGERVSVAGG